MKTGTCHFKSHSAALNYYRPYLGVTVRGQQVAELRALVDDKLRAGEIRLGKPRLKPGQTLTVEDGRYHITETK